MTHERRSSISCLAGLVSVFLLMQGAQAAAPTEPVAIVVELFTSEGCSSCPPADALLQKLVDTQPIDGVRIVALGEHVDYWDRLGWKDRFSSAALTARQQLYVNRFNLDSAYTPQIVVDGRAEFVGSDAAAARRVLERARATAHGTLRVSAQERGLKALDVAVDVVDLPVQKDRADVVVAVTEAGLRSNVTRGENHGRVLAHAAVVRYFATIGEAPAGRPATLRAEIPLGEDWRRDQLTVVAFVQERRAGAILASVAVRAGQVGR
jgi:hypothetical protein